MVCGLPGVGKTTVSEAVSDRFGSELLRTDVVRRDVVDQPEYTEGEMRRVYEAMFDRAGDHLARGTSAVLDGTFKREDYRTRARGLAEDHDAAFHLVRVECDRDVVRDRMAAREDDASDADFEIHERFREEFEPIQIDHATVDNSRGVVETRRRIAGVLPGYAKQ